MKDRLSHCTYWPEGLFTILPFLFLGIFMQHQILHKILDGIKEASFVN